MGALSLINIIFKTDLSSLSTGMQNANRELNRLGGALQNTGRSLSTFVTLPLVAAGAASIKMASDLNESNNKVEVAFKNSAKEVQAFGKTTLETYGIAEGTALDMAALFGDMATSMGLPDAAAAKMSTSLVGLAGDLASFKNIPIAEAQTALAAVFTGETESLKRLGIVMTETNLQQFALSKGINKNLKDFSQAEKVQLRYAYVMANTKNAQGDFARTSGGAANQMRIFQEGTKQLSASLGQALLPSFTSLVKGLNGALSGFNNLSDGAKSNIVIFGGLAAAAGPVLLGVGKMITGFVEMRSALAAIDFSKFLAGLTPVGAAIGIAVIAYTIFNKESKKLNEAQQVVADVTLQAKKNIAGEVGSLNELVKTAKNEIISKKERQAAIDAINKTYPIYNGNITLENINTREVTAAINDYVASLEKKAMSQAAQAKREELFSKRMEVENRVLGENKNIMDDVLAVLYKKLGIDTTGVDIKNREELERYIKSLKLTGSAADGLRKAYEPYLAMKTRDLNAIDSQITALRKYVDITDASAAASKKSADKLLEDARNTKLSRTERENALKSLKGLSEEYFGTLNLGNVASKKADKALADYERSLLGVSEATAGTIQYYEAQIENLQKEQKTVATTSAAWRGYEEQIQKIQNKIKAITGERTTAVAVEIKPRDFQLSDNAKHNAFLDQEIEKLTKLQQAYGALDPQYKQIGDSIKAIQAISDRQKSGDPFGLQEPLKYYPPALDAAGVANAKFGKSLESLSSTMSESTVQFQNEFVAGFAEGLGKLAVGQSTLGGVFKSLSSLLADFVINIGKQLIAVGTASEAFRVSLASPATAIAVGVATVAAGAAFKAAFDKMPAYQDGGVVGGNSFYGDKILARVNSGELILNRDQQARMHSIMASSAISRGASSVVVQVEGRIRGNDIDLVQRRANDLKNRLG